MLEFFATHDMQLNESGWNRRKHAQSLDYYNGVNTEGYAEV